MSYIEIQAKSDDCAHPNPVIYSEYITLTREELHREYWPFLEETTERYLEDNSGRVKKSYGDKV